jgi:hypothetical protein
MRPDHRRAARQILNWTCVMSTPAGTLVAPCTVRDISMTGARISLDDASAAPDEFVLRLTRNGVIWRKCQTVWRDKIEIGVRFLPHRS